MEIYTDGSSLGNPGKGGFGSIIIYGDKVFELAGNESHTTNNRMEMTACIKAVEFANKLNSNIEIKLYTDSAYLINGTKSWVANWVKNNWKTSTGSDVLNKDLWQELYKLVSLNKNIKLMKVKGHSGDLYNERADTLATQSASGGDFKIYSNIDTEEYAKIAKSDLSNKKKTTMKNKKSNEKPFGYVSNISGEIKFHKTWEDCEKRVKGKNAKFQKVISEQEKNDIIGRWTLETFL